LLAAPFGAQTQQQTGGGSAHPHLLPSVLLIFL
jgi:hypothetical protein